MRGSYDLAQVTWQLGVRAVFWKNFPSSFSFDHVSLLPQIISTAIHGTEVPLWLCTEGVQMLPRIFY